MRIKNIISYFHKNGIRMTIAWVLEKFSIILYGKSIAKKIIEADKYYKLNYPDLQPLQYYFNESALKRINLVIPSLEKSVLYGGLATCLIIITKAAVFFDLPLRIIIRDKNDSKTYNSYDNFINLFKLQKPKEVIFHHEGENAFDISRSDIFFASSWWTAHIIRQIPFIKILFHIIQEAETLFYSNDYNHLLCNKILNDDQINFIVNSSYLFEYFNNNFPNIFKNGIFFEPAFPLFNAGEFKKKININFSSMHVQIIHEIYFFLVLKYLKKALN
jgi:hypothetical protein